MFTTLLLNFTFWYICSGYDTKFLIISGVISSILSYLIAKYLKLLAKLKTNFSLAKSIMYLLWLIKEMFISAYDVSKYILGIKKNTTKIITINTEGMSDIEKLALANSITLTPGTITISSDDDQLTIHLLDYEFEYALEKNIMLNKIKDIKC